MIPGMYRDIDAFLGELLARVDERTVLVVVSDHGHSPSIVKHGSYTDHRHGPPGIVILHGGPVRAGADLTDAHVYDVFPTVLHLLGLPVPADGAGKVLTSALDDAFVAAHPVRTIATYRGAGAQPAVERAPESGQWNRQEVEKLRALGYVR